MNIKIHKIIPNMTKGWPKLNKKDLEGSYQRYHGKALHPISIYRLQTKNSI